MVDLGLQLGVGQTRPARWRVDAAAGRKRVGVRYRALEFRVVRGGVTRGVVVLRGHRIAVRARAFHGLEIFEEVRDPLWVFRLEFGSGVVRGTPDDRVVFV